MEKFAEDNQFVGLEIMERKRKLELDNESETENSPSKKIKKKYPIEFKLKLVQEAKKSNFSEISRKYNVSRPCIRP